MRRLKSFFRKEEEKELFTEFDPRIFRDDYFRMIFQPYDKGTTLFYFDVRDDVRVSESKKTLALNYRKEPVYLFLVPSEKKEKDKEPKKGYLVFEIPLDSRFNAVYFIFVYDNDVSLLKKNYEYRWIDREETKYFYSCQPILSGGNLSRGIKQIARLGYVTIVSGGTETKHEDK